MESFHGNEGGVRELSTKGQKGLFLGLEVSSLGQENGKAFGVQVAPPFAPTLPPRWIGPRRQRTGASPENSRRVDEDYVS